MKKTISVLIFSVFLFLACVKAAATGIVEKKVEAPTQSIFEGKNLVTFGNSITAAENSWAYQLSKELKFGNLYNGAVGGSIWSKRERTTSTGNTIRTQNYNSPDFAGISNSNAANPDDLEYQKRINNCAVVHIQKYLSEKTTPNPDFIILSYGTNDLSSTAVLGDATGALQDGNLNNLDLNTIAGAVKWCIKTLQTKFPKAKLFVSLPLQAESENRNKDNLKKMAIITKICHGMSVPYFDCYTESGITQENSKQYLRDGLHPNEDGKAMHGKYIIRKLTELAQLQQVDELPDWALGPFVRPTNASPIISPDTQSVFFDPMSKQNVAWEASDVFNPGAAVKNNKIYVLYRGEDRLGNGIGKRTSRLGIAESTDGIKMKKSPKPVMYPDEDGQKEYEWPGGCEDPRIAVTEEGLYVMLYTQWNRKAFRLAVATSKDLINWTKHGPVFHEAYHGRFKDLKCKSASIVTKIEKGKQVITKLNGKYMMYWGERSMNIATSDDLINWEPTLDEKGELDLIVKPRKYHFDSDMTECGPPAIVTNKGILVLYNGKNKGNNERDTNYTANTYAAGQILFDLNNPSKIIGRLDKPFFVPTEPFEKSGQYPSGTVFVEGLVYFKDKWFLYYGCADSRVGVAIYSPQAKK